MAAEAAPRPSRPAREAARHPMPATRSRWDRPKGPCVLILTNQWDSTSDRVAVALRNHRAWVFRFDTADFPVRFSVDFRLNADNYVNRVVHGYGPQPFVDLDAIDSIWYGRPGYFRVDAALGPQAGRFAMSEADMAMSGILRNADAFWMNHPAAISEAQYKPVQLQRAAKIGLRIPDTIVTNDPDAAYDFAQEHPGGIVVKTLSRSHILPADGEAGAPGIIYTSTVTSRSRSDFQSVRVTPCLLQELIPKQYDVRVTLVGKQLFSVAIESQADPRSRIDWRTLGAGLQHKLIDLPAPVGSKLLELARSFKLNYAAIDLVKSDDGEFVFLEVNSNGEWEWLEVLTGAPIADTIADALVRKEE